jgi:hypothetical protein
LTVQTDTLSKTVIEQAVSRAYEDAGYTSPDGTVDRVKIRERMFGILWARKVLTLADRAEKAVTRGQMITEVFPDLPGPESFSDEDDPVLSETVWSKIDSYLWGVASTAANSALQRLVGIEGGNGYVLVRTKVGKDRTSACYITDDPKCIQRDFEGPELAALAAKLNTVQNNVEMLIMRQPQNARRYMSIFDKHVKAITAAGHAQLMLALEAAQDSGGENDDSEPDGDEG